jgi:hypothetical protein
LISVQARRAFPLRVEQVVRSEAEKAASQAKAVAKTRAASSPQRRPGRPKGSLNKPKTPGALTPELVRIKAMVDALLPLIAQVCPLTSLVLDGHFGHPNALHIAQQANVHRIATLRCDAALYFPYTGPYAGRGPRRQYGQKVMYDNLPVQDLRETTVEGHIQTCIYQAHLLHKEFTHALNVVIIVKTNRRTQARAHVVWFSSALALAYVSLIDY